MSERRFSFFIAMLMIVSTVFAVGSPAAADDDDTPDDDLAVPELDWEPCYEDVTAQTGVVFECATLRAPLDYDRPHRRKVDVAMVRIPAGNPDAREGAILLNPGGPGGSGIGFVLGFGPFAGQVFGPEVPARFDIVGFDPRGIGLSTQVRCFNTIEEAVSVFPPIAFPLNRAEERLFRQADRALARACRRAGAGRIGRHVSTGNVARDMDLMRAAMGDEDLNYLGLSYGTFLGATYVNMFPDRVRSFVVDGVLDPIAWVNLEGEVPFSTRLRSDEGARETLDEFFRQCDAAAAGNCALAPDSEARYDAVAAALLESPIEITDPVTGEVLLITYQDLIGQSLGTLYSPQGYASLAEGVAGLESLLAGPPPPVEDPAAEDDGATTDAPDVPVEARLAVMFHDDPPPEEPYDNFVEGFPSVGCTDTTNPRSYRVWREQGELADQEFGYFGRIWTWASSPCARWPFRDRDRYEGPFDSETENPVLVIGNLYDPATRYEGAVTLRKLLPESGLLTVDVPGHTSLGISACAGVITGQYFLDPEVAYKVDGTTCPAEFNAFDLVAGPPPPPPEQATAAAAEVHTSEEAARMIAVRDAVMENVGLMPPSMLASQG